MTPDEIRKSVAAETVLISETLHALVTGQAADLTGFDARVADLCLATQALQITDAQALVPDFEKLASLLDDLRKQVTDAGPAAAAPAPTAAESR
jgi:hypothetical protein